MFDLPTFDIDGTLRRLVLATLIAMYAALIAGSIAQLLVRRMLRRQPTPLPDHVRDYLQNLGVPELPPGRWREGRWPLAVAALTFPLLQLVALEISTIGATMALQKALFADDNPEHWPGYFAAAGACVALFLVTVGLLERVLDVGRTACVSSCEAAIDVPVWIDRAGTPRT